MHLLAKDMDNDSHLVGNPPQLSSMGRYDNGRRMVVQSNAVSTHTEEAPQILGDPRRVGTLVRKE